MELIKNSLEWERFKSTRLCSRDEICNFKNVYPFYVEVVVESWEYEICKFVLYHKDELSNMILHMDK